MAFEIVSLDEDRTDEWWAVLSNVFAFEAKPEDFEVAGRRGYDRAIAAVDDGTIVAASNVFPFEMTVPGGTVLMGGLTAVAVMPTHRRRGVLTAMTRLAHDQMREREEPVAGLWAAESSIYGRFGYGVATDAADLTLQRVHTSLRPGPAPEGSVRLLDPEAARTTIPEMLATRSTESSIPAIACSASRASLLSPGWLMIRP